MNLSDLQQAIVHDADSCVMCGMCLPVCPTYQHYRHEAESPRGRIVAMQAIATQRIAADSTAQLHLNHCLGCAACEMICPSQVAYSKLYANTQALLAHSGATKQSWLLKQILLQVSQPGGLNRHRFILQCYQHSHLATLVGKLFRSNSLLQRGNQWLRFAQPGKLQPYYSAKSQCLGEVALFTGCMGSSFDFETLHNSIQLLNQIGYHVHVPDTQSCCGALHQQHGESDITQNLAEHNQKVFNNLPVSHVIYTSPACGERLRQSRITAHVTGILDFLAASTHWEKLRFHPLTNNIVLHQSCSTLNKNKNTSAAAWLLRAIPQLQPFAIQPSGCCGAGGSHALLYPELADAVLQTKIQTLKNTSATLLVSDNISCSLHFRQGLQHAGIHLEVAHPVTLLARQLIPSNNS